MSRDGHRDALRQIGRSNSEEELRIGSRAALVHSRPTAHGAGQRAFGARDDGSSMSSSNEYVTPPSFISSNTNNTAFRTTTALDGAQTFHADDLSLPIQLLEGEELKLRDDISYRPYTRPDIYRGELIVTNYRLMFVTKPPQTVLLLVDVPLGTISQIEKVGGQARSQINDGAAYGIEIYCKDFRQFFFANPKEQNQRRNLTDQLNRSVFPFSINKADVTNPSLFFSSFFAHDFKRKTLGNTIDEGWTLYNKMKEYTRMGIQQNGDPHWSINSEVNKNYALCDTYPDIIVIPSKFDTNRLQRVAEFRSRNRIPVLSWYSRETDATITRSSQPLTGLANRTSEDDLLLLRKIAEANVNQGFKLIIVDARPKVNAMANMANGGGYEDYPDCELEFQNIQNIHVMRESLRKLQTAIRSSAQDDKNWFTDLENSNWLFHIRAVLTAAKRLVSIIHEEKRSVLVHCSDGWDRTPQLTSLAMLMLDPYYRKLSGYLILIEKEWLSFGHKFFMRIGHGDKSDSERSPVFLQFLDCTFQLMKQFPNEFEFSEKLLITIADNLYSCQFGTFLLNSEKVRVEMKVSEYTMSAWTPILQNKILFINPFYNNQSEKVLHPNVSSRHIKLWKNYYCRHLPGYQPSQDAVIQRFQSLNRLKQSLFDELEHLRQDPEQLSRPLTGAFLQTSMVNPTGVSQNQSRPIVSQTSATFIA